MKPRWASHLPVSVLSLPFFQAPLENVSLLSMNKMIIVTPSDNDGRVLIAKSPLTF